MPTPDHRSEEYLRRVVIGDPTLREPIVIADYDPEWPRTYRDQADRIAAALGDRVLALEHVGSTSVPGLAAKPKIDIDLIVADPAAEDDYLPALEAIGYRLWAREPDWYEHRCLVRDDPQVNLHVFGPGTEEHERHLIFRDRLRAHSADRERYENVKRRLAERDWKYMTEYAEAKSEVVEDILARARR